MPNDRAGIDGIPTWPLPICYSYFGFSYFVSPQANRARRCVIRFFCPHCSLLVVQDRSETGTNFCPHCQKLFKGIAKKLPTWIVGVLTVLVVLVVNWQIMLHH